MTEGGQKQEGVSPGPSLEPAHSPAHLCQTVLTGSANFTCQAPPDVLICLVPTWVTVMPHIGLQVDNSFYLTLVLNHYFPQNNHTAKKAGFRGSIQPSAISC